MEPKCCPKFESCNANLCPLDSKLHLRAYYGETICFYVRQHIKVEAEIAEDTKLKGVELEIMDAVEKNIDLMKKIGGAKYRYKLDRASRHKSKSQTYHFTRLDNAILRGPVAINEGSRNEEMGVV